MMKLISWNVNGIRAAVKKGFYDVIKELDADFVCVQETKMQEGQEPIEVEGYHQYWDSAHKKGYSGTLIFAKEQALSIQQGINIEEHDTEGRVVTLEYPDFYLVNCYTPNSQRGLARLDYRMQWEDDFQAYITALDKKKPVILCGDLNVAHQEIDIKNAASNRKSAGFTEEERAKMTQLLESGFIDTYRHFYPEQKDAYTWWSYMGNARENNVGWRIDYFVVSKRLGATLKDATIYPAIMGSDHCPVGLLL